MRRPPRTRELNAIRDSCQAFQALMQTLQFRPEIRAVSVSRIARYPPGTVGGRIARIANPVLAKMRDGPCISFEPNNNRN